MANDGFTAQTTNLQSTAPQVDAVNQQLQQISQNLVQALDAEGACWGNDEAGHTFGQKYFPSAFSALKQMNSTQEGLQSMVDGIRSWAKNYLDADQQAKASISQINSTNS